MPPEVELVVEHLEHRRAEEAREGHETHIQTGAYSHRISLPAGVRELSRVVYIVIFAKVGVTRGVAGRVEDDKSGDVQTEGQNRKEECRVDVGMRMGMSMLPALLNRTKLSV